MGTIGGGVQMQKLIGLKIVNDTKVTWICNMSIGVTLMYIEICAANGLLLGV